MNHIELFAGCGGLSLGLESVGFELALANEISPMASETFAYNFFKENLQEQPLSLFESETLLKTKWLSSNFSSNDIKNRLREDPRTFLEYGQGFCDFSSVEALKGNLLVANIIEVNKWLEQNPDHLKVIKKGFGSGSIDLVSGGPPCQSFSMAGMRQLSNSRNILPWEFVKFVQKIQPKVTLLENVTGILRAFKVDGKSYYAWFEIAKAFAKIDYIPLCLHINAKYIGIAQNRPRFILIAVRNDIFKALKPHFNTYEKTLFKASEKLHININNAESIKYGALPYFDINKEQDLPYFENSFLHHLIKSSQRYTSVSEAIDDLRTNKHVPSDYIKQLNQLFKSDIKPNNIKNHEYRNNTPLVKRRFRIYQVLTKVSTETQRSVKNLLKGAIERLSTSAADEMLAYRYLNDDKQLMSFLNKQSLENYLLQHKTKKQTQKALIENQPAPAALSIADDACHYHSEELRTLTVREMARIQSFPDNFVFRSKVTTGGKMRRFEVPQYTQVGNAVPPLLGRALGLSIKSLLQKAQ
jgi:DNA (cytosine-5)-methyltransferase 1